MCRLAIYTGTGADAASAMCGRNCATVPRPGFLVSPERTFQSVVNGTPDSFASAVIWACVQDLEPRLDLVREGNDCVHAAHPTAEGCLVSTAIGTVTLLYAEIGRRSLPGAVQSRIAAPLKQRQEPKMNAREILAAAAGCSMSAPNLEEEAIQEMRDALLAISRAIGASRIAGYGSQILGSLEDASKFSAVRTGHGRRESMSHRRTQKPAYIWGALSNTEPPDDDEDIVGYYGVDVSAEPNRCYLCGAADGEPCQRADGELAECLR